MFSSTIKEGISQLQNSKLFSRLELLQILKMMTGYKSNVRLIYSERSKVNSIVNLLQSVQINTVLVSSYGFYGRKDRGKGGWSNLCNSASKKHKEYGLYLCMYSHEKNSAQEAETSGDDTLFGETLSYPVCCNRFFGENFETASKMQGDLFPIVYRNTRDNTHALPSLLNPLWYFDAGYIEYWPCSFRCEHALAEAAIGKKLLETYLPDVANEMNSILNVPVLYTEYSGIFIFHGARYDSGKKILEYEASKIQGTEETPLANALRQGNQLIFRRGHWDIYMMHQKKHSIVNKQASLAVFSNICNVASSVLFEKLKKVEVLQFQLPGTTLIEMVMLVIGEKRALRLIVKKQDYQKAIQFAQILGLKMFESPLRVSVVSTPGTGDEYVEYVKSAQRDASYLICYAQTTDDARACAELETMDGDKSKYELNRHLNYPVCCVGSFLERTPHDDWLKPFLKNTPISKRYPVWTNRIGYLFTGKMPLYDYEPCGAFCPESMELGRRILETFRRKHIDFLLRELLEECRTPVFLHEGVLVLLSGAEIRETPDRTELCYNPHHFQLKGYAVRPEAETSLLWESNRMIVDGRKIRIFHDAELLAEYRQTQYNNRIFIFEE